MKHKFVEHSAMAVVLNGNKVLTTKELIYGKEILSLPKGHVESNETILETSIRECYEETNYVLTKNDYVKELTPFTYEFIDHNEVLVSKTIYPFLFKVDNEGNLLSKEKRILEIKWIDINEFYNIATYENVKVILKEVIEGGL